jgi:hypothetical protein
VHTAPVVQRVSSGTDVKQLIDTAVKQAIAETEARQKVALEQALAKQQHGFDLQHKATLAVVSSQLEYYEKLRNVALHAENEMPRGAAQQ